MNADWYLDPIRNHYADFSGRATRSQFWMFVAFNLVISLIIFLIDVPFLTGGIVYMLFGLLVLVPSLAIGCRRLHDVNRSGWLQLLFLVPIIGWTILANLFAQPGYPHENQYGPLPVSLLPNA